MAAEQSHGGGRGRSSKCRSLLHMQTCRTSLTYRPWSREAAACIMLICCQLAPLCLLHGLYNAVPCGG